MRKCMKVAFCQILLLLIKVVLFAVGCFFSYPTSESQGGLFPIFARFNHSCTPNVTHRFSKGKRCVFAARDIRCDEELFNSYVCEAPFVCQIDSDPLSRSSSHAFTQVYSNYTDPPTSKKSTDEPVSIFMHMSSMYSKRYTGGTIEWPGHMGC